MNNENFGKIIFKMEGNNTREVVMTDSDEIDFSCLTDMFVSFSLAVGHQMGSIEAVFEAWLEDRKSMNDAMIEEARRDDETNE